MRFLYFKSFRRYLNKIYFIYRIFLNIVSHIRDQYIRDQTIFVQKLDLPKLNKAKWIR